MLVGRDVNAFQYILAVSSCEVTWRHGSSVSKHSLILPMLSWTTTSFSVLLSSVVSAHDQLVSITQIDRTVIPHS